ncbi:MAG TPA: thioredoxin family protein [Gammaproteobacteria bacterium]
MRRVALLVLLLGPWAGAVAWAAEAPAEIAWFDGGVEAAFAKARAESKPVFLFWGAVWCPYCADLKAHVFSRPDFVEKLDLFVPVYLDGDDPGAQKWAETFDVAGYPTVLALAPDGAELARIAGGMDVRVYDDMLDLVLGDVRPIDAVLRSVDAAALTAEDCRRLAYNGWGLEDVEPAAGAQLAATLAKAAERCASSGRAEAARLTAIAASYALGSEADALAGGASPSPLLGDLVGRVGEVVADPVLAASVADALQYLGEDFFVLARRLAPEQAPELLSNWSEAMTAASRDERYGEGDRLAAERSKVEAVKALGGGEGVPAPLEAEARALIEETLGKVQNTPARPGAVNGAVNLLVALGDPAAAYAIAEREMRRSKTPYYQMADLAALEEMMGHLETAIVWLERAYRASKGPATRFQWGTNFVRGLIRMTPGDEAAIREAAIEVLGELEGPDRIYRRTRARLETLDASLREWNADGAHAEAIDAIRQRIANICASVPKSEHDALESCEKFLSS